MTVRQCLPALFLSISLLGAPPDGDGLYQKRCAACHDAAKPQTRMPSRSDLSKKAPEEILKAMFAGAMVQQSAGLTEEEGRAIARYVTAKEFGATIVVAATALCTDGTKSFRPAETDWNGWGGDLNSSRFQKNPGFTAEDAKRLKLKWAFGFRGTNVASAQPTLVGKRLFVGSASGTVYSLDAATGCTYWSYEAGANVRTAISIGAVPGGGYAAYFGDIRSTVHAVDATTGTLIWKTKVEEHPASRVTGAPIFYEGRLYVPVSSTEEASAMSPKYECCKFRGSLVALDGATGKLLWKTYSVSDPPKETKKSSTGTQKFGPAGGAIWSSPMIDVKRKLIYASSGNSYTDVDVSTTDAILAFDLETGTLKWATQALPKDNYVMSCGKAGVGNCPEQMGPDHDFGTSPILRTLPNGKQIVVAASKAAMVYGLDPDQNGKILWEKRIGQGGPLGGVEWGHAADDQNVYAAVSDVFQTTAGVPGGLHALALGTGEEVWNTPPAKMTCIPTAAGCTGAQSAAISVMPGMVFSGSVDGHFRGYSTKTGEIIWDFDAVKPFETVNGVKAKGGSFDGGGPTIANGMVFTGSGYGMWQGLAGNVLLAFSVDGK